MKTMRGKLERTVLLGRFDSDCLRKLFLSIKETKWETAWKNEED